MTTAQPAFTHSLRRYLPVLKGIVLLLWLLPAYAGMAQSTEPPVIDVHKIQFLSYIDTACLIKLLPKDSTRPSALGSLRFDSVLHRKSKVMSDYVEKDILLKFCLYNSSDSADSVMFFPGFFYRRLEVYKATAADSLQYTLVPPATPQMSRHYRGFVMLPLKGGEKAWFVARLNLIRDAGGSSLYPRLVTKQFRGPFFVGLAYDMSNISIITYIVSGIMLMMIFYSIAVYWLNRGSMEFIFYAIYTACTGVLLFFTSFLRNEVTAFKYFFDEYLDFAILCGGVFSYMIFIQRFLNTRREHIFIDKVLRWGEILIVALLGSYSVFYFATDQFMILSHIETATKQIMLALGVIFIIYGLRKKDKLLRYLAWGNIFLVIFSLFSLLLLVIPGFHITSDSKLSFLNMSILYYEIGLVAELVCFLTGLAYKNKRDIIERVKEQEQLKLENERKEFEKQVAVLAAQQDERNRISADMHDELGSGVTAISLMSEIVKSKLKQDTLPEIDKISSSANDLLGKMNTIIWTMKSSNDTLESLIAYIRAHAIEFFDSTPIACSVYIPEDFPDVEMTGEKRRNIFLSIKEALTNIMKHAQASKVQINIFTEERFLFISISDDGVGINTEKLRRFGNGMSNMRRRIESIEGSLTVESSNGTTLLFMIPAYAES